MKRSLTLALLTLCVGLSTAKTTQACLYIPWLDPFAWMGFYGCGYGGCGHNPCGYGRCHNYGVMPQVYAPQAPLYAAPQTMSYPVAPSNPGCNCTGAVQQPALTAVQVPVTTYRPVTRYVPQTTYRTQYRAVAPATAGVMPTYTQPQIAYNAPLPSYSTALATPSYPSHSSYTPTLGVPTYTPGYPTQSYTQLPGVTPYSTPTLPTPIYSSPQPMVTPGYPTSTPSGTGIASPTPGDILGDHEYPTQSAVQPQRVPIATPTAPIRQASWTQPQFTRSYPLSVR